MSIQASDLMQRAAIIILDETNVRWPLAEMLLWLNDAQRAIVLRLPNALSQTVELQLQAGTYQQLPDQYLNLLRVKRNLTSPVGASPRIGGRAIRLISREVLDTQSLDWSNPNITKYQPQVKHYMFDEQDQKSFDVYPGNDGTGVVEAIVGLNPQDVALATGADPLDIASYELPIALPDIYSNTILNFMLFRAYSKDAQFAGNDARATSHYTLFSNDLQARSTTEMSTSPNVQAQTKTS